MTNPPSLRQRAQAGDPQAIAALMNRSFQQQGIRATAIANGPELNIYLEAEMVPDQRYSRRIQQGLTALGVRQYTRIVVHGRQAGTTTLDWSQPITQAGRAPSSAPSQRPATQPVASAPAPQRTATPRSTRPRQPSTQPSPGQPRSPLQSINFMVALFSKWVFFNLLVSFIPTLILMAIFGLIPLAIYLVFLGVVWGRVQSWVLRPYLGDRAAHWQASTQWGLITCGGVVLAIRFVMYAVLRRVPLTEQVHWWIGGGIVVGVTVLGYLLGKIQASCFEPDIRDRGPARPPGGRWWGIANAGIGCCVGGNLTLVYLNLSNPSLAYSLRLGLITLFPAVLTYLICTGLMWAYCLEIEQRQRLAAATHTDVMTAFPAIPGLEKLGRVPLALPVCGIAVIPPALLTPILPSFSLLTLLVFWLFAYQVGSWLRVWAFASAAVMTLVAMIPFVGFVLFEPGMRTFAIVAIMVILGLAIGSLALSAITWLPLKNWRTAGGIALLGPSLSFACTGLMVLAAF